MVEYVPSGKEFGVQSISLMAHLGIDNRVCVLWENTGQVAIAYRIY